MHGPGKVILAGVAALTLALMTVPPPVAAAHVAAMPSDFNGDGYADLAIGVPGEGIGAKRYAGAVNVLYGAKRGLTAAGDQLWSLDSPGVKGTSNGGRYQNSGDRFGSVLASGDFDRDGYADLAIGVPQDRVKGVKYAGAVTVLYGSKRGLSAAGDQRWSRANLPGAPEKYGHFGDALAAGDFDGDGFWDLAIYDNGSTYVLFGGRDGLAAGTRLPASGSLAAGDLDGDRYADLAVGGVHVFYGSPTGPAIAGSQVWDQDSPGMLDGGEGGGFGASLAIGDFDADGFGDLAVGVPVEGPPGWTQYDEGHGAVAVLYGTADGLTAVGNQLWFAPASVPLPTADEYGPRFGATLAAGDFDGDGAADLAIGAPYAGQRWGVVYALYGGPAGLSDARAQLWSQDSAGVPGSSERGDRFGGGLASADYGRSGRDDLAIGAYGEDVARGGSGRVTVLYGRASGLSARHAQAWSQNSPGVLDRCEGSDYFGWALSGSTPGHGR